MLFPRSSYKKVKSTCASSIELSRYNLVSETYDVSITLIKTSPLQEQGCGGGGHTTMLLSLVYLGSLQLDICSGKRVKLRHSKWGVGSTFMSGGDKHLFKPTWNVSLQSCPSPPLPPPRPPPTQKNKKIKNLCPHELSRYFHTRGRHLWHMHFFLTVLTRKGDNFFKALNLHSMWAG